MSVITARTTGGIAKVQVVTAGDGYSVPPNVVIAGGATPARAYAVMAGTRVADVIVKEPGAGYSAPTVSFQAVTRSAVTISAGTPHTGGLSKWTVSAGDTQSTAIQDGVRHQISSWVNATQFVATSAITTGSVLLEDNITHTGETASATAYAHTGSLRPVSLFSGRYADMYGVDGMGRGFKWTGASLFPIGIGRPAAGPTVTTISGATYYVSDIQLINPGAGYHRAPSVTIAGTASSTATARAEITNGRVTSITVVDPGSGYTDTPDVQITGGIASGQSLTVSVLGRLGSVEVTASGSGYTTTPRCTGEPVASFTASSSISVADSGLSENDPFYFTAVTGGTEVTPGTTYYAVSVGTGTFYAATAANTTSIVNLTQITQGQLVNPAKHLYIQCDNHGLTDNDEVVFSALSGGAGLSTEVEYFATSANASQFKVATATGGSAVPFTTAITAGRVIVPPPSITLSTAQGLTGAAIDIAVIDGKIASASVLAAGTGATSSGVTASITGGGGTGGAVALGLLYRVNAAGVATSGTEHHTPPVVTILPDAADSTGGGGIITADIANGGMSSLTVVQSGEYSEPPTAVVLDTQAEALATISSPIQGKYRCAIRYLDDTPRGKGGPRPSSISNLTEVNAPDGKGGLTWRWQHPDLDDRVTAMELWRTTADQSVVLFRVATIQRTDANWEAGPYTDNLNDVELQDPERDDYALMPITLPSGQINARRFGVPPGEFFAATMFQDRLWMAGDSSGDRPNALVYSEVDEPESVPAENEIVVQENAGQSDRIVGLVPFGSQLLIAQQRHLYALAYVSQPVIDASMRLVAYRGLLNNACWDVLDGVAFMVDSYGMYAFDGQSEAAVSVAVDNYWRDGIIDFSKQEKFHVQVTQSERVIRFFYCQSGDTEPTRALCYCPATKCWWEETFPTAITASCESLIGGVMTGVLFRQDGSVVRSSGLSDLGAGIPYEYRSGNLPLSKDGPSRAITVLYNPTTNDGDLRLSLRYNNSGTPRTNAVATDRGSGWVTVTGSTEATLNMAVDRSDLGDATGTARAYFTGRMTPESAGGDRHVAIALAGTQTGTSQGDDVKLYSVLVEGAG